MTNHRQIYVELANAIERVGPVPCQALPEIFFPEDYTDPTVRDSAIKTAKSLCRACPVQLQCFEYAIIAKERHGVWGGTLPSER